MNNGTFGYPAGQFGRLLRATQITASGTFQIHPATRLLVVEVVSASTSNFAGRRVLATVAPPPRLETVTVGPFAGAASSFGAISSGTVSGTSGGAGWITVQEFG